MTLAVVLAGGTVADLCVRSFRAEQERLEWIMQQKLREMKPLFL